MDVTSLAAILGPAYAVLGLSVLLYAKSWQTLIHQWIENHFLLFPIALFELVVGLFIVRQYNVWEGNVWVLVTLTGWCMLVEGLFYMLAPGAGIKGILRLASNVGLVYLGGLVSLAIGAVLSWQVYF